MSVQTSSPVPQTGSIIAGLTARSRAHVGGATSRIGLIILAVLLVVFFQIVAGGFATTSNGLSILVNAATTLIASIAMARLIIAGQIDLSIGGMFALVGVITGFVLRDTQSVALGLGTALLAGLVFGLFNGFLVLQLKISPLIVTLALMGVYSGIALVLTQSLPVSDMPFLLQQIVQTTVVGIPMSVIIALVVFALGSIALTRTVGGVRSYAIGGDSVAADRVGVKTKRHVLMLFCYMGISIGLVAFITVGRLGSASPLLGTGFEFDVITAVILGGVGFAGGTGRPVGVLFGVLTIAIVNTGLIFIGATDYWRSIISGGVLLLALTADQINDRRMNRAKGTGKERTATSTGMDAVRDATSGTDTLRAHSPAGPEVLRAEHLAKSYGAVTAVSDISLKLRAGQVTCLLGDNGAGKSTLIKMLSGVVLPDTGEITLDDRRLNGLPATEIRSAGIETVYQDLAVCPNLGAAINLSLAREPRKPWSAWMGSLSVFDRRTSIAQASDRMAKLGVHLDDYSRPVRNLSGGQRQCVAIARTIVDGVRVVILDEPTAALGVRQKSLVLRLARRLADDGAAVVMITHDVEAVGLIADHVVVLNLGRTSYDGPAGELGARELVHLMAGFPLTSHPTPAPSAAEVPTTTTGDTRPAAHAH